MEGTLTRGLRITTQILSCRNPQQLVEKMARYLTPFHYADASLAESLSTMAQCDRRELPGYIVNANDEAEGVESVVSVGDKVPPSGPPLAWTLIWKQIYVNIYGEYVPESLKQWGWVMWDEGRWAKEGELQVRDLVVEQWKTAPDLLEEIKRDYPWLESLVDTLSAS
ncbi:unnamed protein product [Discula destructiva]